MRELLVKLLRYGLTGGAAAIVDIGGFVLLRRSGWSVLLAGVTSFCLAAVVNYLLSSHFVFSRAASVRRFGLFFMAALLGLTINVGVTLSGTYLLGMVPLAAKIAGIALAFLINFAVNVRFVFRSSS